VELAGVALDADLPLPEAVLAVARELVPTRVGAAFVTLGGDGAVLVDADGAWFGTLRPRACAAPWARATARWRASCSPTSPALLPTSGCAAASATDRRRPLPGTQAPTPISSPATCR
jgi:1-phosphofructokinase